MYTPCHDIWSPDSCILRNEYFPPFLPIPNLIYFRSHYFQTQFSIIISFWARLMNLFICPFICLILIKRGKLGVAFQKHTICLLTDLSIHGEMVLIPIIPKLFEYICPWSPNLITDNFDHKYILHGINYTYRYKKRVFLKNAKWK